MKVRNGCDEGLERIRLASDISAGQQVQVRNLPRRKGLRESGSVSLDGLDAFSGMLAEKIRHGSVIAGHDFIDSATRPTAIAGVAACEVNSTITDAALIATVRSPPRSSTRGAGIVVGPAARGGGSSSIDGAIRFIKAAFPKAVSM